MSEKMSAARVLDYIDARQMAKAMARWRVAGDLSDEQLQEDSAACRYLHRSIAELTEDYVPYAVAAIKALGAEPVDISALQREADGLRTRAAAQTKLIRDLIRATDPVAHDNRDAEAVLTTVWRLLSVASQEAYIEEATRNLSPQDQAKEGSER